MNKVIIRENEETRRRRWLWAINFRACWNCGRVHCWPPVAVHHLVGGPGRSDEVANWSVACGACHATVHGERVIVDGKVWDGPTKGQMITLKQIFDPTNFDLARLEQLAGRKLEIEDVD